MKGLKAAFSFALITFSVVSTTLISDGHSPSTKWLASQIYNAAFNDISPGFDDLYIIKTQDKDREIVIYCNTTYCYKNRNAIMTS